MYRLTTGKSSGPRPPHMACQFKEKNPHARALAHTRPHTQKQNRNETQKPSIFQQYTQSITNTNSELFYNASFLNTKDAHPGCIYIFFSVVYCWLIFKYISVTTCNCFPYLTAFPFIYLRVSSFHLPTVQAGRRDGAYSLWNWKQQF